MIGLADPWIAAAYILVIASALLCVVYGAMNWNKGAESEDQESSKWKEDEIEIGKNL